MALCDGNDECAASQQCNFTDRRCDRHCDADGDCVAGELCAPGAHVCRGRCRGDGDCQGGETCVSGRCEVTACGNDGDCASTCAIQRVPGTLREPSPLVEGGRVVMWVERVAGTQSAIWRAVSDDGLTFRFDPPQAVLAPGADDGGRAGAPSVIRAADGYLLAFANGAGLLRRATSSDGVAFTVDAQPLLAPSSDWEAGGLDAPALAPSPSGGLACYYGTRDRAAIGLAESADGLRFAARPSPVLTPSQVTDPTLWRGVDAIASPFAEPFAAPDGTPALRLYFAARGRESGDSLQFGMAVPEAANFSVGEASSTDGRVFVPWPYDPVFDRVSDFTNHTSEMDPAVARLGETRLMYYRGGSATEDPKRAENLGVARNPIPAD